MGMIRSPAVADLFYPGDAETLSQTVATLLDEAGETKAPAPKALIVPHAGYIYSGPIAASAYACLRPYRDRYRRVVLLGPCHRVPVRGLALSNADAYRMPGGDVLLDKSALELLNVPGVRLFDRAHVGEHSLEVHLPFLQAVLETFTVVPIVVGDASAELVADVLGRLWGGDETLIVVSSDLCHYLPYDEARASDAATCEAVEHLDGSNISHDMACGATPVSGLLLAARQHGLDVTTLDLRNSGDTAGDREAVVGYGSWMFA
jgi:AmmeMemoRadiSam system protein B